MLYEVITTAAIDISIFYDNAADGNWDGLANWTTLPDLWNLILSSSTSAGTPFYEATIPTWNNFSQIPYILYKIMPDATITDPGEFCRITSYNVCYTKLLRPQPEEQASQRQKRRAGSGG